MNPNDGMAGYWDATADQYQSCTRISVDDFHYGPLLPGDRELGLLPSPLCGLRCLEVGCGAGQNSIFLAREGAECVAVDISKEQLACGEQLARQASARVDFRLLDMDELSGADLGTFDLVHSTYALPFSHDPAGMIAACAALIGEGGCLLLTTGHPVYAGLWLEEEDGMLVPDYFHPPSDSRTSDDGESFIHARFHPLGRVTEWIRACGLNLDALLEPEPVPLPGLSEDEVRNRVPYDSADWRALYPQLARVPAVAIFRCLKPADA